MADYRSEFNRFVIDKQAETGDEGGIRISMEMDSDGESSFSLDASRSGASLEVF